MATEICVNIGSGNGLLPDSTKQFPHSAFARGPRSPALEEGMRAAMGATRERCEGPYA